MKIFKKTNTVGLVLVVVAWVGTIHAGDWDAIDVGVPTPSAAIIAAIGDEQLEEILNDVLTRNPELASQRARVQAAQHRAPQARVLPDLRAELTAYLLPPETRVGPQRLAARISQPLPGGGKRKLRQGTALLEAAGAAADLAVRELQMVTEARRLFYELAFVDAATRVIRTDRATLDHFEELARARYSSGVGLQKDVIQIQAEITRLDARLAEFAAQRASKLAALNLLRDRAGAAVTTPSISSVLWLPKRWDDLRVTALANRPEMVAAEARIARSQNLEELASKDGSPDFSVGVTYALVEPRSDANPPDNGQDIFGVSGGITLPVWRKGFKAGVEEATQGRLVAEAERRATVSRIDHEIEELRGRMPEIQRQVDLFSGVLLIQSEQALRSAEAAYVTGRVDGLALLDAERVLLDVRLATERARTDLAIAHALLEGAIGSPLNQETDHEDA